MKYLLLASVLTLAACGGGGSEQVVSTDPPRPPRVERTVLPQTTDVAISPDIDPNTASNPDPAIAPRNQLLVFLPGTGHTPAEYTLVQRLATSRGYHAVGLVYPNALAVATLCTMSEDADCHGKVRREVITGEDTSDLGVISPADSIVNRLQKLLVHLRSVAPAEGWGQYLDANDQVVWNRINLAGHSQGAGHAGMMAKMFGLNRIAYFSGPSDWRLPDNEPATWTSLPNVTSASRQYGLNHIQDTPELPLAVWSNLGLNTLGEPVIVETVESLGTTHQFITNRALVVVSPHDATVLDAATPLNGDGVPVYAPLWIQMIAP